MPEAAAAKEKPAQMQVVAMVKEMPARTPEAAAAMEMPDRMPVVAAVKEMQGQRRKQM